MTASAVPFVFSPNTLIQSAQVNADFSSVVGSLNNIDAGQITTGVLPVANGGTGVTTSGAITTSIGAVAKSGDTMTGPLTVPFIRYSADLSHGFAFSWDGANAHFIVDGIDEGIVGDITNVTPGNGLAGGGSTGNVTLSMSGSYSGNLGVSGAVQAGQLTSTGNINANSGTLTSGAVVTGALNASSMTVSGDLTAGYLKTAGGDQWMGPGGSGRILQMAGGWYWDFNPGTGDLVWGGPSGAQFWVVRYSDHYCGNQIGPVFGFGAYINSSDVRGKTDVEPAAQGLAEILRLRPVTFKRTDRDRTELGFTAQDVQEILPEAVWPLVDGQGADSLGVTLDPIVASLVNAVQQLAAKVEALEAARGTS